MMKKLVSVAALSVMLLPGSQAQAHNVWCHCPQKEGDKTLEAFEQAERVTALHRQMLDAWYAASVTIEHGVIAEFKAKLQGTKLQPQYFVQTFEGLERVRGIASRFEQELERFKAIAMADPEPNFTAALTKILAESDITRLSSSGIRYANVAGGQNTSKKAAPANGEGCGGVIDVMQTDMQILNALLDETIDATRDAIPLAEQGDFSKVMLSGRNRFGDKMPQLTDAFSRIDRTYVELVLTTITATMQVYPNGFEFLEP